VTRLAETTQAGKNLQLEAEIRLLFDALKKIYREKN